MPNLKKEDVILKLQELEIEYDSNASYSDLVALMKKGKQEKVEKEEAKEEPKVEEKTEQPQVSTEEKEEKPSINPFTSFNDKTPLTKKAEIMRKKLLSQPRVPVMIPLGHEEKLGSTHQITLNGYTMFILKGMMVDVPLQVKEVLDQKFAHQMHMREHPLRLTGDLSKIKLTNFD